MIRRKLTTLLLISAIILSCVALAGCNSDSDSSSSAPPSTANNSPSTGGTSTDSTSPNNSASNDSGAQTSPDAPPPADDTVYDLIVSVVYPSESAAGAMLQQYCDQIEERSGGRVQCTIHFSGSLLGTIDSMSGVVNGIADVAFVPSAVVADYWPINYKVLSLPFIGYPNTAAANTIYDQLCLEFPEIEEEIRAQGVMTVGTYMAGRMDLYLAKDANISMPEDLKGLKISIASPYCTGILTSVGAAPVGGTSADLYTSISSGVTEGAINHTSFMMSTGAFELTKTVVLFGERGAGPGLLKDVSKFVMNTGKYNSLPEDLQKIVFEAFDGYGRELSGEEVNFQMQHVGIMESMGANVITLSDDAMAAFKEIAEPICEESIAALESQGIKAQAIYDRAVELAAASR